MSENFSIEVEDREKVSAIHHKAPGSKWIFFCHGYGAGKDGSYVQRCEKATENGFNAVRFDFRGNGESDGEFIDQDLSSRIKDLKTVIDFFDPEKIFLFGMSFGGKVVLHTLKEIDIEAVVFKSPVLFNEEMEKFRSVVEEKGSYTHFGDKTIDERFFEDFDTYSFEEAAKDIEVPVAIFHGGADSTVKFENSADAVKKMNTEVMLRKFEDEKHSMSDDGEEKLLEEIFWWLERKRRY